MKWNLVITALAVACAVPSLATAQQKKVTCADNTIVTSDAACRHHGGVQKPGGLNKAGQEVKGTASDVASDVTDEAKRAPSNVKAAAKTTQKNVGNAAGDVSKTAQKVVHPKKYKAKCTDGTTYEGRQKSNACKNHGGVANWS
jgi:hypothetical protein